MKKTIYEKAARLADTGCVKIVRITPNCIVGIVQGDHDRYDTLTYIDHCFFCTCKWGQTHNFSTDWCSHAMALQAVAERMVV